MRKMHVQTIETRILDRVATFSLLQLFHADRLMADTLSDGFWLVRYTAAATYFGISCRSLNTALTLQTSSLHFDSKPTTYARHSSSLCLYCDNGLLSL